MENVKNDFHGNDRGTEWLNMSERYVDYSGAAPLRVTCRPHQPLPFSLTISNTCSLTWVIAYQLPLAFDPLKELAKVEYVACSNGSGTFPPLMLTSL